MVGSVKIERRRYVIETKTNSKNATRILYLFQDKSSAGKSLGNMKIRGNLGKYEIWENPFGIRFHSLELSENLILK